MSRLKHGDCQHCNLPRHLAARGLCSTCYADKSVRFRYRKRKLRRRTNSDTPCRACEQLPGKRAYGLCFKCFADPWVVETYAPQSPGHTGGFIPEDGHIDNPPGPPTPYLPWQPEYLDVLAGRVAQLLPVFSPGDAIGDLR